MRAAIIDSPLKVSFPMQQPIYNHLPRQTSLYTEPIKRTDSQVTMPLTVRPAALAAATHASFAAHVFALVAAILVLVWTIHFEGGLSLHSDNEDQVFNVNRFLPLSLFSKASFR